MLFATWIKRALGLRVLTLQLDINLTVDQIAQVGNSRSMNFQKVPKRFDGAKRNDLPE